MEFRTRLLQAGGCSFRLEGVAEDAEDWVYAFALDCSGNADGDAAVCIRSPESLAGVTAETDGKTGNLRFDGVCVSFGIPEDARLAPLSVPSTLLRAWAGGCIASAGEDGDAWCTVYTLEGEGEPLSVYTWSDAEGRPIRAELVLEGRALCRLTITDFELDSGGEHETSEADLG